MAEIDLAGLKKIAERVSKVKDEVAAQCVEDPKFRAAFVADPKAALAEEYGLEASFFEKLNVKVVEQGSDEVVIPIPTAGSGDEELTDAQLEAVAGGFAFTITVAGVTAAATAAGAVATSGLIVAKSRAGRRW